MEFDNEKLKDTLDHARVNYWAVTFLCSTFLSLLINKLILLEFDVITLIYLTLFIGLGFGSIKLSRWVESVKGEIVRNNRYERKF